MIIVDYLRSKGFFPKGVVHVGASLAGEMADYISLSPERIVWIEADPSVFARLKGSISEEAIKGPPHQILINALVTDKDGDPVNFKLFSNNGESSSIFSSTDLLRSTWTDVHETGATLDLTSRRLDTLLTENGLQPTDIDVLIFDVQGAELLGLRGAGDFLRNAKFVEVESSLVEIYAGAPLAGEVDAYLTEHGFRRETPLQWHGDVVYERA